MLKAAYIELMSIFVGKLLDWFTVNNELWVLGLLNVFIKSPNELEIAELPLGAVNVIFNELWLGEILAGNWFVYLDLNALNTSFSMFALISAVLGVVDGLVGFIVDPWYPGYVNGKVEYPWNSG